MKILHQLGHNRKWNIDSFVNNDIGDGLIYGAYNVSFGDISNLTKKIKDVSMIDLQYYGKHSSGLGKLNSYPFHPSNTLQEDKTLTDGLASIITAITFQENLGLKNIIIPNYYESKDINKIISLIKSINKYLGNHRSSDRKYYMTLIICELCIENEDKLNNLLTTITDMNIVFDGYYIVCESEPKYKQKISIDYRYHESLLKVLRIINKQGFKSIYAYANWDALVFLSLTDIDYLTIGTYENLRNFNHTRYSQKIPGGPSDGWYFSEKLLNFVRANEITKIRSNGLIEIINNDDNIFSDTILNPSYIWNTHKPDVHKNYLLSISRLLTNLASIKDIKERVKNLIHMVESARELYRILAERKVFLIDESDDYHLGSWLSFLRSKA